MVSSGAVQAGAEYDYTYLVSISGTGLSVDNIFVGSDDLSPLNVAFKFNNAATADWSWFSDNTPENYIDFYNTAGGTLGSADTLKITFSSFLAPAASHFAVGENSSTSAGEQYRHFGNRTNCTSRSTRTGQCWDVAAWRRYDCSVRSGAAKETSLASAYCDFQNRRHATHFGDAPVHRHVHGFLERMPS